MEPEAPETAKKVPKRKLDIRSVITEARIKLSAKAGEVSFNVLRLLVESSLCYPVGPPPKQKDSVTSWRQDVEPGGDHISDVSVPASRIGNRTKGANVRPIDSVSCVSAPSSGVSGSSTASKNSLGSRRSAPSSSEVGSITAISVQPPTPKRKDEKMRTTLQVCFVQWE